jgi:RNA polymerase-binding transcription factor DksA
MADKIVLNGLTKKGLRKKLMEQLTKAEKELELARKNFLQKLRQDTKPKMGNHLAEFNTENRTVEEQIKENARKRIKKIKEALQGLDDGTYGICNFVDETLDLEGCGKHISLGRLWAVPFTNKCIDCKRKKEREERIRNKRPSNNNLVQSSWMSL